MPMPRRGGVVRVTKPPGPLACAPGGGGMEVLPAFHLLLEQEDRHENNRLSSL